MFCQTVSSIRGKLEFCILVLKNHKMEEAEMQESGVEDLPHTPPPDKPESGTRRVKTNFGKKLTRKSKAQLLNKLSAQLKFYFSDSNLWKDKFLQQKIAGSTTGHVEIGLIASFNRVKALTKDWRLVSQAAKMCSPLLEVSADGRFVRRATPLLPLPEDLDERTIYIEALPREVNHDMIKSCFSVFGAVAHISLPKFKINRAVKGFAFVEFISSTGASQAINFFDKLSANAAMETASTSTEVTCSNEVSQSEDSSVRHVSAALRATDAKCESETISSSGKRQKCPHSAIESDDETTNSSSSKSRLKSGVKRKHEPASDDSEDEITAKPAAKRRDHQHDVSEDKVDKVVSDSVSPSSSEESADDAGGEDNQEKKRTRSHWAKKSKWRLALRRFRDWRPKVLSKVKWLQLKEEYRALQREQTLAVKEYVRSQQEALHEFETAPGTPRSNLHCVNCHVLDSEGTPAADDIAETEEIATDTSVASPPGHSSSSGPGYEFVANSVIRLEWSSSVNTSPWTAILLKRSLAAVGDVNYVDFVPGEHSAYARCKSAVKASALLQTLQAAVGEKGRQGMCRPDTATLVTGDEEQTYWKKLRESRQTAHERKSKRCRSGGKRLDSQVKRLAAMEKAKDSSKSHHIMFDESDEDDRES